MPSIGDTLLRVMMIGSGGAVQAARASGATVITPPPLGVGTLEWHQMDLVVEAGRMAARRLLEETGGQLPSG
jgi:predicted acylesterase/phospholipase RssA